MKLQWPGLEEADGAPPGRLRQADLVEGTAVALRLQFRGGDLAGGDQRAQGFESPHGLLAESGVEDDVAPALRLGVEDRAGLDGEPEHFLEPEGLGAALDPR